MSVSIHVLDLCAGSGAIGLAVAKKFLNAQVDFIEIDANHNSTINRSIEINQLDSSRIHIYNGNLFNALPITKKPPLSTYDYILSNPPYIDKKLERTESSVVNFEPHLALYGGFEGLELIERILADTPNYLAPDGELWLEHEPEQSLAIQTLAEKHKMVTTVHNDQYNIARYSVLRMAQY